LALAEHHLQLDKRPQAGHLVQVDARLAHPQQPPRFGDRAVYAQRGAEHGPQVGGRRGLRDEVVGLPGAGDIGAGVKNQLAQAG